MKQTKTKLLCLLLAALMLLSSLTACGKDKAKDSNLIKLGDYELLYKGACIMEDSDGNDAIVLTLDFTNNGKENASYLWSVDETVMQNGVELETATVFTDYDTFETVIEGQFADVAPGATLEVRTAYLLQDTTSPVEATFEQFFGKKSGKVTIDPTTLSREDAGSTETMATDPNVGTSTMATTGDALLDYITRLTMASREHPNVEVGVSPRGALAVCRMAKAFAYLHGRDFVMPEDVAAIFPDVCAHRLMLNSKARMMEEKPESVLAEILKTTDMPVLKK